MTISHQPDTLFQPGGTKGYILEGCVFLADVKAKKILSECVKSAQPPKYSQSVVAN